MAKNMGVADRVIRVIIAVIFALLILLGTVKGVAAWVLGIIALILLVTSIVAFCPLYKVLGIRTLKEGGSPQGETTATT
ncbi:MAG: membrane protein [Armatimonadota bacterium]|nr:MAG: membrane protein [Armatimonadota bacterium]